jgi:acyl-[acyl-carrier-protein] desaturase
MHILEPTIEANLNRHLSIVTKPENIWYPHQYIPYDIGTNYDRLGGQPWDVSQSTVSQAVRIALLLNLLTEDNLPSYHRVTHEVAKKDGPWRHWVGRWTAEENKHSIVIREFLHVTRMIDPIELEDARMRHVTNGYDGRGRNLLETLAYVTSQELATRISHRNTGIAATGTLAEPMLQRISTDENLHMLLYRNLLGEALDIAPNQTMVAIYQEIENFEMPGANLPDFGRKSLIIAEAGIYGPDSHLRDVLLPTLKVLRIFSRTDLSGEGEQARERLAIYIDNLERRAKRFEERLDAKKQAAAK